MTHRYLTAALLLALTGAGVAAQQAQPGAHFMENWDLDADGKVTKSELTEKRQQIFTMFDQDGNGVLDSGEYELFDSTRAADMQENAGGSAGPMAQVSHGLSMEFNDVDGDGQVSHGEFVAQSDPWFGLIDSDGNGALNGIDFSAPAE